MKRYTKKNVKHELTLAKRRLTTFSSHTDLNYELDDEYFLALQPAKAIEKLKTIRWSNVENNPKKISYKGVSVTTPTGKITKPLQIKTITNKSKIEKAQKDTEKQQKKDYTKAKRDVKNRLKTISEHTGLRVTLNENELNKLSVKARTAMLNEISFKNLKSDSYAYLDKYLKAFSEPNSRYGKIKEFEIDDISILRSILRREKITGEKVPTNLLSNKALPKVKEWYDKYKSNSEWKSHLASRDEHALNNYKNNVLRMKELNSDRLTSAVADIIIKMLNEGRLTVEDINKRLNNISGINLFDSDVQDGMLKANGERILNVLRDTIPITDKEIDDYLKENGYTKEEIDEILTY